MPWTRPPQRPDAEPSAVEMLRAMLDDVPRMIGERVQLLTLELQRAKQAFIVIAAMVIVAALLMLTAWFVIWGSIVAALIQAGLAWGWAVLIVLVVNIGGAAAALAYASSLSRFLSLPATVRHLTKPSRRVDPEGNSPLQRSETSSADGMASASSPAVATHRMSP